MRVALLALAACVTPGTVGETKPPDFDGDGADVLEDCDDQEPRAAPGLPEICDGIDNDCDGAIDTASCDRSEVFVQTMTLDMLVVVDDSASMAPFQEAIAASFDDFLQWIVGPDRDAHIGVISMDMDDPSEQGRLVTANGHRFVDPSMAYEEALAWADQTLQLGADPEFFSERGLDAAHSAVTEHASEENTGFRRENAHLSILFITDEDDEDSELEALEFVTRIRDLPGAADFTVHAVVSDDPDCLQEPGLQYQAVSQLTGGLTQSICAPDYGQFLSAVGQISAQHGLLDRFPLAAPAQPGTVSVSYEVSGLTVVLGPEETVLTADSRTVILLAPPPPTGSQLTVKYRVSE